MKKTLTLLALIAAPFANASDWIAVNDAMYRTDNYESRYAAIATPSRGVKGVNIGFMVRGHDDCTANAVAYYGAFKVNGQRVNFQRQCFDDGSAYLYPSSNAGRTYVINQFKTAKEVIVVNSDGTHKLSAIGYTEVHNNLMSLGAAL